jgi:DNA-binding transcriptional ArsR family regulator
VVSQKTKKGKKGRSKNSFEAELIKALSHPLRARALAILNERVASPKEIAAQLREPVGKLSYHVRELHNRGFAELVKTVPRRGATEHFYRGTARSFLSDENWAQLSPYAKDGFSVANLKMINDTAKAALLAKTFDSRNDRHLSCTPLMVDEEGWKELVNLLSNTLDEVFAIQANSVDRHADTKGDTMRATVSLLGFESPSCEREQESPPESTERRSKGRKTS